MTLSEYERKEWERIQVRKADSLQKKTKNIIPARARDRVATVTDKAKSVPGAGKVTAAYAGAARGLGKATASTASRTVSPKSVIRQYGRAGHDITELQDIQRLDLSAVDSVAKLNRIRYGHALTGAASGFASSAAVTGGELLASAGTVAGAGAGAAPGLGTVAVALGTDVAGVLGLAARSVAATALYYGYDPLQPEEEIFMMSVIGLGMASGTTAKTAAYSELSQLTQLLAKNASWAKLEEKVLTKIAQRFAAKFGEILTKRKLGQFVPVAGMLIGAGLNYWTLDQISVAAHDAYRERFLIDKSGGDLRSTTLAPDSATELDDVIDILEILEDEGALPNSDPADGPNEDVA